MNLHEHQAKTLFRDYGIHTANGLVASNADEAIQAAEQLGGNNWVVKAQVHTGGRGKGGGVKRVTGQEELTNTVNAMLGSTLVTHQTGKQGLPINQVLIEELSEFTQELYLSALIDRKQQQVVFIASSAGGMDIEEVARDQPEAIFTVAIDPCVGLMPYQCRQLIFNMGLPVSLIPQLYQTMKGLYELFLARDLSLLEINPLVITKDSQLLALDGKINIDDNALFRQKALMALRDETQEDERENHARQFDLNYVTLDGNIGCMVNGAGLAMATMDLIKLHGGNPANFLDVGGGITVDRVVEAFKLVISDQKVNAILVNIFGGIVRCDLIADGIIRAMQEVALSIPVVVRLQGTNVDQGLKMLQESGLEVATADDLTDAAVKVVKAARGEH